MFIAAQLKEENIAEYILYMWQTEDLLRSLDFDSEQVEEQIIQKYTLENAQIQQIRNWYSDIIQMATAENIKERGHLQVISNIVYDLNDLHLWLLSRLQDEAYEELYAAALPEMEALSEKMRGKTVNDIDLCLQGLYTWMLMRLEKKQISAATEEAMQKISRMVAYLSAKYADREQNPDKYYE